MQSTPACSERLGIYGRRSGYLVGAMHKLVSTLEYTAGTRHQLTTAFNSEMPDIVRMWAVSSLVAVAHVLFAANCCES